MGNQSYDVEWPNYRVLAELVIYDSENKWFDNINTSEIEKAEQIIIESFFDSFWLFFIKSSPICKQSYTPSAGSLLYFIILLCFFLVLCYFEG